MHKKKSWILRVRNLDAVKKASVSSVMSAGRLSGRCGFSIWGWHLGRDGWKLGSVGTVGRSISWWPLQHGGLSRWLDLYHGSSVLLWAKGELHGLL